MRAANSCAPNWSEALRPITGFAYSASALRKVLFWQSWYGVDFLKYSSKMEKRQIKGKTMTKILDIIFVILFLLLIFYAIRQFGIG